MRMKRRMLLFIALFITILFSGCLSSEEKKEGRQNVDEAKPFLKEYVKDKYGKSAKIINYSYVTWTKIDSVVASRDVGISSCVTAQVQIEDDIYTIMYDLNTREFSSDEYLSELKPEILRMFSEDIGFTGAFACDIDFQDEYLDVSRLLPVEIKPTTFAELCETVDSFDIMIYSNAGDWDEHSFSGDIIRSKLASINWDKNKFFNIYILNMYDKEKYGELKSQDNSMWYNTNHIAEFDGYSVNVPEESYVGEYASSAYLLRLHQELLQVYAFNENSIQEN